MILKLENTTTHQIFEYDVIDKNYGEKLYFRFDINTLQLEDGEYSLTLYDGEDIVVTDLLKVGDFNPQTLQYKTGDNTYISIELGAKLGSKYAQITDLNTTIFPDEGYDGMTDVVIDATPIYNNTKIEWYTKGKNDQKKLLSSIEIDTNGVYTNENGYDEVVVNVPDLNGAYDDGYSDGKTDGYNQGYAEGEKVSYDNGYSDGKESVASNARVLDVTENGSYLSEFSEEVYIYPDQVTGDFGDGNYFYDWGEIKDGCFNTEIPFDNNTRIEFWWKAAEKSTGTMWQPIFGAGLKEDKTTFEIRYYNNERTRLQIRKGYTSINFVFDNTIWNHFVYENNMLYLNGTLITTFTNVITADDSPILINSAPYCYNARLANGLFGMFKINEHIFIPKDGGFINYQTGKQLGGYTKIDTTITYEYERGNDVTGEFGDGTQLYDYAVLNKSQFNTGIIPNANTRIEFWYKYISNTTSSFNYLSIIGTQQNGKGADGIFKIIMNDSKFRVEYDNSVSLFNLSAGVWHKIVISADEGVIVDGEQLVTTFDKSIFKGTTVPIYINSCGVDFNNLSNCANGEFGMIKIDNTVIIPTDKGFINYDTEQLLETNWISEDNVPFVGSYTYTENEVIHILPEGPLYKTVTVNVLPKINIGKEGIKFGDSTFKKVPEWTDWEGITNMNRMFTSCSQLQTIPLMDTSKVTDMAQMFYGCGSLVEIPLIDISNNTTMNQMFYSCGKLTTIPQLNTVNVKNMNQTFNGCSSLVSIPPLDARSVERQSYGLFGYGTLNNLTDFGGLIGLKASMDGNYSFDKTPNLTYESCINILNGLYDFTGNGETPASNQGKLKVHSNFLTTVGDEISIGTNKGWTITA